MPYRFPITSASTIVFEAIILGFVSAYQLASSIIDNDSWMQIKGESGALFILSVGVVVLWNAGRVREANAAKREIDADKKSEAQHAETLKLQKENSEKLMSLQAESIIANLKSTQSLENHSREIVNLITEIRTIPNRCPQSIENRTTQQ